MTFRSKPTYGTYCRCHAATVPLHHVSEALRHLAVEHDLLQATPEEGNLALVSTIACQEYRPRRAVRLAGGGRKA
jgi:hypothetical protein